MISMLNLDIYIYKQDAFFNRLLKTKVKDFGIKNNIPLHKIYPLDLPLFFHWMSFLTPFDKMHLIFQLNDAYLIFFLHLWS